MGTLKNLKSKIRELNRKRINNTRNFILNMLIFLFDSDRNKVVAKENAPIIILRSDGKIGDSIIATGFFRELRRLSPHSPIYVIGSPQVQSVYKKSNFIDEIIIYKKGFLSTLKIFFRLRKINFKYFINTTDEIKPHAAFFQGQLKAENKMIFCADKLKSTTKVITFNPGQSHFSCLYENLLSIMFPNQSFDISYELTIEPEILSRVEDAFRLRGFKDKKVIAFNAFGGTKLRSFNYITSCKIIKLLLEDPQVIVVSLASPQDAKVVFDWKNKSCTEMTQGELQRWVIMDEFKSLEECFGIIKTCDLLVSPDTSLVHAACALKSNLVAVFRQRLGYQNSSAWGPRTQNVLGTRVIHAVSHSPTTWDVNLVRVEEVKDAAYEILGIKKLREKQEERTIEFAN